MKTIYSKNKKDLFLYASNLIEDLINNLLKKKDKIIIGVSGGRNAKGIYCELSKKEIKWDKVHIFMVDERLVSLKNDESNFKIAKENLIDKIEINYKNLHPFILKNKKDYGLKDYTDEFKEFKKYDIILLSAGEDCHIGSIFPEHNSFKNESKYFILMDDSPKQPPGRISMSKNLIKKSENAILFFIGDKKEAYSNFLNDSFKEINCPAKLIKHCKNYFVFTNLKIK